MNEMYFDCGQCGHIGALRDLVEHPTRPMSIDLGFCPKCGTEVDYMKTEAEIRELLVEYHEDPDAFFAQLNSNKNDGLRGF